MESESKILIVDIRLRTCGLFLCSGGEENPTHERVTVFPVNYFKTGKSEQLDFSSLLFDLKNGIRTALKSYPSLEEVVLVGLGRNYCLLKDKEMIEPFYLVDERVDAKLIRGANLQISYNLRYDFSGGEEARDGSFYRLVASLQKGRLREATDFLFPIEYLYFLWTDQKAHSRSLARTNGFFDAEKNRYSTPLIHGAGIPMTLLPQLSRDFTASSLTNQEYTEAFGKQLRIRLGGSRNYSGSFVVPSYDDAVVLRLGDSPCIGAAVKKAVTEDEMRLNGYRFGYMNHRPTLEKRLHVSNLIYKLFRETKRNFASFEKEVEASSFNGRIRYTDPSFAKADSVIEEVKLHFRSKEKVSPETPADVLRCLYLSFIDFAAKEIKEYEDTLKVLWHYAIILNAESSSPFLKREFERATGKDVQFYPLPIEVDGAYLETFRVHKAEEEEEARRRELEDSF